MADNAPLFTLSHKFASAVLLINKVDPKRLSLILNRLIGKLKDQKSEAFSKEEEERLMEVLSLSGAELKDLMDISSFIFEQAAYVQLSLAQLKEQLTKANIADQQNLAFLRAWESHGRDLINSLKNKSVVPQKLTDSHWRLHLQTGQTSLARVKAPTAIFQFDLTDDAGKNDSFVCEFTRDDLYSFFADLEKVQDQLDQLA
eukprot:CAMPEP_0201521024 /NCGR_PEP_ID=MMETSP0161_2-20130828/13841_1 /ASSEMBLY_ACC=CAM_ASM_000251 /TAXON_ID=180227 /ORGANISM="Neoparamoeba aestuarina, Strain SoJaBio B1-5/56/2" /LENGTH=200 /DNA_ID=CAMNT_0047919579 /DNA_START=58 /DNA_END=660 /DNA_ORIENTATION=+